MIRLRQVALVARDLDQVVAELCRTLGLSVCFHDPGVGEFGLHNALMVVGDQFIEVVAPIVDGTTAERYLNRRAGDGGERDHVGGGAHHAVAFAHQVSVRVAQLQVHVGKAARVACRDADAVEMARCEEGAVAVALGALRMEGLARRG